MAISLTDKTISSINWNLTKTYGKAGINIIVGIILARLLPPADFGLLGMTVIFTGLADLFSTLGMGASIVKIKELNNTHISVATLTTVILGILVFTIFFFLAPIISNFYNEPKLILILRLLSIIFILKGLSTVSYSLIMRRMDFKSILKIELGSFLFGYSFITILLAFLGMGVWSLVIGRLSSSILSNIQIQIKQPIKLKFEFSKKEFNELFSYGSGLSISKFLNYTASNIDYLIIGKFLNSFQLGLYQRAYNLMTLPISQISSSIYNVLFPAFSRVQDNPERLRVAYLRTIKTVVFLIFPILTSFIIGGEYVILGLYGENWSGAINAFKLLAIAGFFRTTLSYSGAIAHATGKVYTEVIQQLVYLTVLAVGVYIGIKNGIEGASVAVVIALFILFLLQSLLAMNIAQINIKSFLISFLPGFVISIFIAIGDTVLIFFLENISFQFPYPIKLALLISISGLIFILSILFLPKKIKGDVVSWLLNKYEQKIPNKILGIYYKFNSN
jgi:PST family polysaccharide transporter